MSGTTWFFIGGGVAILISLAWRRMGGSAGIYGP